MFKLPVPVYLSRQFVVFSDDQIDCHPIWMQHSKNVVGASLDPITVLLFSQHNFPKTFAYCRAQRSVNFWSFYCIRTSPSVATILGAFFRLFLLIFLFIAHTVVDLIQIVYRLLDRAQCDSSRPWLSVWLF